MTNPRTSTKRYLDHTPNRIAPTHSRATTTLRLAGHQLPEVRTHPGTVTPENNTTTGYGLRNLTVSLRGIIIYCHSRAVVEEISAAWDTACHDMMTLPPHAPQAVTSGMHPHTDAGTRITTAVTFHDMPGIGHRILQAADGYPELVLTTGPLAIVVRDRTALGDIRAAWSYATEAAARHWAHERTRSDWDHIT